LPVERVTGAVYRLAIARVVDHVRTRFMLVTVAPVGG
jgi:hypothetical protein